jgi:predicted DCC family thiol-disulfide oxidoreductase YuxK
VLQHSAAQIRQSPTAPARVKKIAAALGSMRQGVLRHSVAVERALAALVPAWRLARIAPAELLKVFAHER